MKSAQQSHVVMIGPALSAPGGMSAVVSAYRDAGLFADWNVRYLNSYERPGLLTQLRVMGAAMASYLGLLLTGRVKLVHVHSASRGSFWRKALFCWLARLFGRPYVFHLHSGEFPVFYQQECGALAQRLVRSTLEHAGAVVALTASWEAALRNIAPAANILSVGNFVVVGQRRVQKKNTPGRVLFLGRLREKKGVFDLVNAVPAILNVLPNVKFTLAGDGEIDKVRDLAAALGVADNVDFPGWVDGAAKDALLAEADVLVLPSYFEGLPICILEAMATGVPVVSTRVGGIPEVLEDGQCGLLLEPGAVPALSEALILLLSNEAVCEKIVARAYLRVEQQYSARAIISALSRIYQNILHPPEAYDA